MPNLCRCCNSQLPTISLIAYKNMPKSAQFFPTKEDVQLEKGVDIFIYQCSYCGLLQIPGDPVPYYKDVIRSTGVSQEMSLFRTVQYKEFIDEYNLSGKKVIEIGSGCGEYMNFMKVAGIIPYGLENLQLSVDTGKKNGLNVFRGFINDRHYKIPEAPYDAFYIMNFLEHIPEPNEFLKGIYNNLAEDAVGIVEVPNVNMMIKKMLFTEFISDHILYFTKSTLKTILETNGFEVVECKEIWYDYIISATVRKKKQLDVSGFKKQRDIITKSVNDYVDNEHSKGRKVASWGAGHQALASLSLTSIAGKLECVIDSAKFKQDKFTPATHLPIVAPEILYNGQIDAVLIMAAGFSDEVAEIVKNNYPELGIAILRDYGVEVIKE